MTSFCLAVQQQFVLAVATGGDNFVKIMNIFNMFCYKFDVGKWCLQVSQMIKPCCKIKLLFMQCRDIVCRKPLFTLCWNPLSNLTIPY